jgi:hypothetical protein
VGLAFTYFDHKQAELQKPADYIAMLLRQFEQQKEGLTVSLQCTYNDLSKKSVKADLETLKGLLVDSVKSFESRSYIILDGFDECLEDARRRIIETIGLLLSRDDQIYFFIASRPNSNLDVIPSSYPNDTQTIDIIAGKGAQSRDLKSYIFDKLSMESISEKERAFISKGVVEKAQGLYKSLTVAGVNL